VAWAFTTIPFFLHRPGIDDSPRMLYQRATSFPFVIESGLDATPAKPPARLAA
jgi:hypothetical protein